MKKANLIRRLYILVFPHSEESTVILQAMSQFRYNQWLIGAFATRTLRRFGAHKELIFFYDN